MNCAKCGADNREGRKFCAQCAAPLARLCPQCGVANEPGENFCGECAAPLGQAPTASAKKSNESPIRVADTPATENLEGERKTVTALFADIKGSTELEQDLDPEEARAIVDPALKLMIDAVRRYDGYIVQSTGDGIFALFGAPVAHEDHPQRALYSALRMQEELTRYSARLREAGNLPLEARVGVNTGEVVIRSITTGEGHTEYTPIGHTANLASRMQALAPTGSIAISEQTRKLVEGYFELKELGPTRVKGVSEPVNVHEVTGLGPLRTRLQRSAGRGLSKFVGRQAEMDSLKRAAEQAKAGRGQIVAAIAEAGTGKSRLFFEFKAKNQSGWMVLEAFSVSHGKASAYLPLTDLLHTYFEIEAGDDSRKRREKVTGRVVSLDRALADILPYLFALLGLVEAQDPLAQMDGQIKKRRTLDAIKRILLRESLNQPLMVVFEDLHWIDEATQALLNLLADSIGTAKILLLVSYRPEYSHQWNSKTYYTQLRLDPLGKESADQMLNALLGDGKDLSPLKRLIIERTEGNPFFMEEAVQVLLDEGGLVRDGAAVRLSRPLNELKIPPTVQAILAARIDRLAPDHKDLLQALAVIGAEFRLGLVRRVLDLQAARTEPSPTGCDTVGHRSHEVAGEVLERMLSELQLGEFIYEQPAVGDIEYTFKHALTREVVYGGLLKERRKVLHMQIGVAIETLYAGQLEGHLSELARHYSLSPDAQKAVEYLNLAGEQAIKRSAHAEAVTDSEAALSLLQTLPASRERDRRELALQILLGSAAAAVNGIGAPERERSLLRARDLSQRLGEQSHVFPVLWQLFHFHAQRGELQTAQEYAEHALAMAESQCDAVMLAGARTALGVCLFYIGDFAACRRQFELALAQDIPLQKRRYFGERGFDALAGALSALAEGILGYPDRCRVGLGEVVKRARTQSSLPDLAFALVACGRGDLLAGSPSSAQSLAEEAITLSETHGFVERAALGKYVRGVALTRQGEFKEGIACILQGLSDYSATGGRLGQSEFYSELAAAFGKAGRTQEGLEAVDLGLAMGRDGGESFYRGELYRIRGELIQIEDPAHPDEVERLFSTAIDTARRRQARSFELRATTSLARLLAKQGKRDEARAMLAEIYNWFTEGFATADLKDAKALLEGLAG